jgi:hypothetical protein
MMVSRYTKRELLLAADAHSISLGGIDGFELQNINVLKTQITGYVVELDGVVVTLMR